VSTRGSTRTGAATGRPHRAEGGSRRAQAAQEFLAGH
jgi:hypothetical protein